MYLTAQLNGLRQEAVTDKNSQCDYVRVTAQIIKSTNYIAQLHPQPNISTKKTPPAPYAL